MTDPSTITAYRPCVGVMLLNDKGEVWIGRRFQKQNDESGESLWWQMPQGGIDKAKNLNQLQGANWKKKRQLPAIR